MEQKNVNIAMRVTRASIAVNALLFVTKLCAGIFAHSAAMVSDAVDSASDMLSTVVVIIGIKAAGKSSDKEHPYGHERMECVAAVILAAILAATGAGIGYAGITRVFGGQRGAAPMPVIPALAVAIASIVVKEIMYWYTRRAAIRIQSGALMADAWHHRSDALSSVGSFTGILGTRMGFPAMDSLASAVICVFIVKTALGIFRDAIGKMTDRACNDEVVGGIRETIAGQEGVAGIDMLKTRRFGEKIYVDVEISADRDAPLHETHDISHRVHDAIEAAFPQVKHCMVHVNPISPADN